MALRLAPRHFSGRGPQLARASCLHHGMQMLIVLTHEPLLHESP
jgi:hypothetical protein